MPLMMLVLGSILLTGQAALADPIGPEFPVNTYTTGDQGRGAVAVAADPAGNFVVVWDTAYGQDGDESGVFGQRFDSTGTPVGPEFQVNTYTTGHQGFGALSVAADAAGNFVVVWVGEGAGDSYRGVFGRRFDSSGNPVGGEFMVNSYTTGEQGDYRGGISVASDPGGNFVVVWSGEGQGDSWGVFGRRFDNLGGPQGSDFLVNTYTTNSQGFEAGAVVAADATGNFVVVWDSYGQDGDRGGIFGQRFDSTGSALGSEFQVNTYTTSEQGYRSVALASDPAGNFMVAWDSYGQDGDWTGVFARRFDSAGSALGNDFQVNTYTFARQGYGGHFDAAYGGIAVAADPAGNFVVVWDSDYNAEQDGNGFGVFGQRYDSDGNTIGGEFQVNTYTTGNQTVVAVAAPLPGEFVVTWSSVYEGSMSQDGSYTGVFGQRFGEVTASLIAGRRMAIRNPTGSEHRRTVVVSGKEKASDIAAIDGDPVANGATLRVIANGTTDSDRTFVLDGSGWTATRSGFRYRGPTGADGDPVSRVSFARTRTGTVVLKAILRGTTGTQDLDIVPPNTGDTGGIIVTINSGGTYCIAFGGAAGGREFLDTPTSWQVIYATAQPGCPAP
jgi:hypothetical protein